MQFVNIVLRILFRFSLAKKFKFSIEQRFLLAFNGTISWHICERDNNKKNNGKYLKNEIKGFFISYLYTLPPQMNNLIFQFNLQAKLKYLPYL